jgi:hypothetical protein
LKANEIKELKAAKVILEHPSLAARIADVVGKPLEAGFNHLPIEWNNKIGGIVQAVLLKGLEFAVYTMGDMKKKRPKNVLHQFLVTASGAASGFFGLAFVAAELPIPTTLMLRSIADIARSEGHDISLLEVRLSCLSIFALGGKSPKDDAAENGYWLIRSALAKSLTEASQYFAQKQATDVVANKAVPSIARLMTIVAERFEIKVTEEYAAKAIPIVGAVSGGSINLLFMQHFQDMAKAHFTILRLEKKYGAQRIKEEYDKL